MGYKFAFALSAGLLLAGCSSDDCSRANDLINACASPDVNVPQLTETAMSLSCTGAIQCQAQCINRASCLEIEALQCFNMVSCVPLAKSSQAAQLAACIRACGVADAPDGGG